MIDAELLRVGGAGGAFAAATAGTGGVDADAGFAVLALRGCSRGGPGEAIQAATIACGVARP